MEENTEQEKGPSRTQQVVGIIVFLALLVFVVGGAIWWFFFSSATADEIQETETLVAEIAEEGEAASPLEPVEPVHTPTPMLTSTPLPPIETPTPLATVTPAHLPVQVSASVPVSVPLGLPSAVQWFIRVQGEGIVTVRIVDLGGAMIASDSPREAVLQTIFRGGEGGWQIDGVIDPNMGEGVVVFVVDAAGEPSRHIEARWTATEGIERPDYLYQTFP